MKNKQSIVFSRREKILEKLEEQGSLDVTQMAKEFDLSPLTIRRDLDLLAREGKLIRVHGGAKKIESEKGSRQEEKIKEALARAAARYVKEEDIVFINSSSTALCLLAHLDKKVTVITNHAAAVNATHSPKVEIVLSGGNLSLPKQALTGEFCQSNIEKVTASVAVMGCSGLCPDTGLSTSVLEEAPVNKLMLKNTTRERIIVTDSSKLGREHRFLSSTLDLVDRVITDSSADEKILDKLRDRGIEVEIIEI